MNLQNIVSSAGDRPLSLENLLPGIRVLARAYAYAADANVSRWEFALEVEELYRTGVCSCDLRWLLAQGLVEHGRETSRYGDQTRTFEQGSGFTFATGVCVVLTEQGMLLASSLLKQSLVAFPGKFSEPPARESGPSSPGLTSPGLSSPGLSSPGLSSPGDSTRPLAEFRPRWDSQRRELCLADCVVKRFRVPAPNQEIILSAFEEEEWPQHIDDPLPASYSIDPKTRLHDTINRLNGKHVNRALRFHGNGNGNGVLWSVRSK